MLPAKFRRPRRKKRFKKTHMNSHVFAHTQSKFANQAVLKQRETRKYRVLMPKPTKWCEDVLDDSYRSDSITSNASTLLSNENSDAELEITYVMEFQDLSSGRDQPSQRCVSDQELLRSAFNNSVRNRIKAAKAWYEERKRAIKDTSRNHSTKHLFPAKTQMHLLLPGEVPMKC